LQPDQDKKPGRKLLTGNVKLEGMYKDPKRVSKDKPKQFMKEVSTKKLVDNDESDDEIPPLDNGYPAR